MLERAVNAIKENKLAYIFIIPVLLFLGVLVWYPFLHGIFISLHEWVAFSDEHQFIGLDNFKWFVNSEVARTSIIATLIYIVGAVFQLGIGVVAAIGLNQRFVRFKPFWFTVFIIPYSMPPIVSGTIWLYLGEPNLGVVPHYLQKIGILSSPIYWQSQGEWGMLVITFVMVWALWPLTFIMIRSAIQKIPRSQYEVAKAYGANWFQRVTRIVLPQIKLTILIVFLIRVVWDLIKVSQVLQLTGGGPGYETSILPVLMYRYAYYRADFGKGYTIGLFLLIFTTILVLPLLRKIAQGLKEEAL